MIAYFWATLYTNNNIFTTQYILWKHITCYGHSVVVSVGLCFCLSSLHRSHKIIDCTSYKIMNPAGFLALSVVILLTALGLVSKTEWVILPLFRLDQKVSPCRNSNINCSYLILFIIWHSRPNLLCQLTCWPAKLRLVLKSQSFGTPFLHQLAKLA